MFMHLGMVGSSFKGIKIAGLAVLFTVLAAFNPRPFRAANAGVNIIVIDPGHGGKDPGNLGTGRYRSREKDVSFDVSQLVKKYIEENLPDTKVILTRDDDQFIELYQRTVIANRANADVFISIHCNANDNKSAYGTESFVLGMGEKDQRLNKTAQLENAARLLEENWESNYEELNANNPAAIIALRAYQDAFLEQSISIADEIQRQFEGRVKRRNRGVKQQPLAVLRGSTMPAVLVELGFLTNPGEEDFLQSTQGKELLASAIYRAVKEYKFKREQRDAGIQTEGSSLTPSVYTPSTVPAPTQEEPTEAAAEVRAEETTREATTEPVESPEMELFFAVQIAVSRNDLPCLPENFKGVESVWKQEQYGLYKYYSGKLATFTDAEALKQNVVTQYPDAYLVAFEKDKKIDLNEAKKRAP
ncbi:MAG: N-acetylmuramoyl-L-alanine amidase [Schleiferiaceae bacterium]|jgi:N-acetylmuramoyl-L-alanine amidase|nr:N-acetylmuramoyl-L-alanine amidase [Schleiferiaceae bacterium]MDP4767224.1 N-acetylmuramoyl-L-alanine amidase [Schleiferiaceae bacterium]MDP4958775.1 N-acetylmuramoyl-L-alanine amidase [Schleiferiaceae bacterium]